MNDTERIDRLEQFANQLLIDLALISSENKILRDMIFGIMKETFPAESVNNNLEGFISGLKKLNDIAFNDLPDHLIPTEDHFLIIKNRQKNQSIYNLLKDRYSAS